MNTRSLRILPFGSMLVAVVSGALALAVSGELHRILLILSIAAVTGGLLLLVTHHLVVHSGR